MAVSTANMNQIRVTWSGFVGGPGISTHYVATGSSPDFTNLRAFYAALASIFPPSVTITFPASGDTLNPTNGALVANWSFGAAPAAVTGSGTGGVTVAQGCQIVWTTNEVADGHAVKGRTFLVPVTSNCFDTAGQVTTTNQSGIGTAAQFIVGATPPFLIWHRPKYGPKPAGGGARPIVRTGSTAVITGKTIPRLPVVLTSRRD